MGINNLSFSNCGYGQFPSYVLKYSQWIHRQRKRIRRKTISKEQQPSIYRYRKGGWKWPQR